MNGVLLIDFENVQSVDLEAVPAGVRVPFFFGASQRSVTRDFLKSALKLGERFVPIDIEGQGKNALDFHIAFYLGEYLAKTPSAECVILSRDKGFDPLVKHLRNRRFKVRRVAAQAEAFPSRSQSESPDARLERALDLLGKMEKKARPRKLKSLLAHLASHFKDASAAEIQRLANQLISGKRISEVAGALTYHF